MMPPILPDFEPARKAVQATLARMLCAGMKILLFLGGRSPPKPSPLAGWFLGGRRGAVPPRLYAQTLPRAGYVHGRIPEVSVCAWL